MLSANLEPNLFVF
jgi:hypothetical protein